MQHYRTEEIAIMTRRQFAAIFFFMASIIVMTGCKTQPTTFATCPEGVLSPANASMIEFPAIDRAVTLLYVDFYKILPETREM